MATISERVLFVGGGNMAHAIVHGALSGGALSEGLVAVVDPDAGKRDRFPKAFGDAGEGRAWLGDGVLVLAVKPQMLPEAAPAYAGHAGLCVSILAGTTSEAVGGALGDAARVVRVMPNTPAQVNKGMSAVSRGVGATAGDVALARALFESVGDVVELEEALMDAFTGVAGSGPAYLFYLVEAMTKGARAVGLDAATARRVAAQTVVGSAALLEASDEDAAALRAKVTSKNGTTHAATTTLDDCRVMDAFVDAVVAARDRGAELGRS